MNYIWVMTLSMTFLLGSGKSWQPPHPKGKCPFKEGVIKKLTHTGFIMGTQESTVNVCGKDSVVLSATNGRVTDVIHLEFTSYITIKVDTTVYTYYDFDRPLVEEGQLVRSGQAIAIANKKRISFFVSNYLNSVFRNPDAYVDCTSELPK